MNAQPETGPDCSYSNSVRHHHFRDKETEAQRGRVTSSSSHSKKWQSQDSNLGHWIWNPCFLTSAFDCLMV